MSAAKKRLTKEEIVEKIYNPKDLSDEKKAQLLNEEFVKFQKEMSEKLGLQIGVRMQKIENETVFGHQAIMVPVKLAPAIPPTPVEKVEENDETNKEN